MNMQHTKGPWELLRGGIEVQSETNEHEIFAYVGEHPVAIASVLPNLESEHDMPISHYSMSEEEGMANARLIAAAPDLLAALEAYVEMDEMSNGQAPENECPRLRRARAAIEKARMP